MNSEEPGTGNGEPGDRPAGSALPYRRLEVWQLAFDVTLRVLDLLDSESLRRQFWLRDQVAGAAASIPANIAEGNGRSTPRDYASFLDRARGSAFQLDSWMLLLRERDLAPRDAIASIARDIDRLSAMLYTAARSLRRKDTLPSRGG